MCVLRERPIRAHQFHAVEPSWAAILIPEFREAQGKSYVEAARGIVQRLCPRSGHLRFIERVDPARIVERPAWEECGQRQLRKNSEFRAGLGGSLEEVNQPVHGL